MPIYEYQCKKCGQFEVMQKITEARLTRCPTCQRKVTKLISNTSFQLKGSGWYLTDYARKDGKPKEASTESKSEGKAEGHAKKDDAASDSKASKSADAKASKPKEAAAA